MPVKRLTPSNYLPILALASLAMWILAYTFAKPPHPPVGTFIGVLAFVAAVVTIWPPDNNWAKAAWLIVFGAFLVLEITTLYNQRNEDASAADTKRRVEDNRFAGILAQNQKEFDATMHRMGRINDTLTGGNGYIYFDPQILGDTPIGLATQSIPKGSLILSAFPHFVGTFPLHDVYVSTFGPNGSLPDIDYRTVFPTELGRPRQFIQTGFSPDQRRVIYHIFINTSNGSYYQSVLLKKLGTHWVWASRFGLANHKKTIRLWSGPDFPKDQLHGDWDKE